MESSILVGGEVLTTHKKEECVGQYCTIHKFSDHHMVTWKQMWDSRDKRIMRICSHNIAHPDPDEINPNTKHMCDGCCNLFHSDVLELSKNYESTESR